MYVFNYTPYSVLRTPYSGLLTPDSVLLTPTSVQDVAEKYIYIYFFSATACQESGVRSPEYGVRSTEYGVRSVVKKRTCKIYIYILLHFLYPNEVSLFFFLASFAGRKKKNKSDHPHWKTFFFFAKLAHTPRKKKGNRGGCFAGEKLVFIINNYIYIYIIYIIKTCFARRRERGAEYCTPVIYLYI